MKLTWEPLPAEKLIRHPGESGWRPVKDTQA